MYSCKLNPPDNEIIGFRALERICLYTLIVVNIFRGFLDVTDRVDSPSRISVLRCFANVSATLRFENYISVVITCVISDHQLYANRRTLNR